MGYRRFKIGCVFAKYDLFKPTIFIQHSINVHFCINLTQFYINFLRPEHQVELYGSRSTPKMLRFQPIPSFSFMLSIVSLMSIDLQHFSNIYSSWNICNFYELGSPIRPITGRPKFPNFGSLLRFLSRILHVLLF